MVNYRIPLRWQLQDIASDTGNKGRLQDVVQDLTRITRYSTGTHAWFRKWRNETGVMRNIIRREQMIN